MGTNDDCAADALNSVEHHIRLHTTPAWESPPDTMESRKNRLIAILTDLCHLADAWGVNLTALASVAYVEYDSTACVPSSKATNIPPVSTIPERTTVFVSDADSLMIDQLHNHTWMSELIFLKERTPF